MQGLSDLIPVISRWEKWVLRFAPTIVVEDSGYRTVFKVWPLPWPRSHAGRTYVLGIYGTSRTTYSIRTSGSA